MAWTSHKLDVNQRTWLFSLSHYTYTLQVPMGPYSRQVPLPKPGDLIINQTWSCRAAVLLQRCTKGQGMRVSGPEVLIQGTILIEYHKVFLLLLSLSYEDLSLTCEPPSTAASLPLGRMSTDGQVPSKEQPLFLFSICLLETKFPMGPGKKPRVKCKIE